MAQIIDFLEYRAARAVPVERDTDENVVTREELVKLFANELRVEIDRRSQQGA